MAWMLQPRSYTQIVRRNLYSVPYQRTGAYKGMGQPDQTQADLPLTLGQSAYIQTNFPTVAAYDLAAGAGGVTSSGQVVGGLTPTPTTNLLPWIVGGIVFLLFVGGRR